MSKFIFTWKNVRNVIMISIEVDKSEIQSFFPESTSKIKLPMSKFMLTWKKPE